MKDAYSFDRDEERLERSFRLQQEAYHKIFDRCGLEVVAVEAESGMMGGSESMDFLAPSGSGENTLVTCERGDYAAALEIPLVYRDVPVLHTGDELNLQTDFGFAGDIDEEADFQRAEALIRSDISAVNGDFRVKENIGEYRCL